jgi:hypothetical protein
MRLARSHALLAATFGVVLGSRTARADNYDTMVTPARPAENEEAPASPPPTGRRPIPAPPLDLDKPAERRSGFVVGLTYGAGLAGSSGYPNNSNDIGEPGYYAASGLLAGAGGSAFIMGALADWLNFGFWFGTATFGSGQWHSTGGGGGLRLEIFPLYAMGGRFRDLAAYTQVGIGSTTLVLKDDPDNVRTGVGSFLAGGIFYEFFLAKVLGGHLAWGPDLQYQAVFSEPLERHGALLGLRFLWYGGR